MFIDADTHVDECAETWSYFPRSMEELKPVPMVFENGTVPEYLRGNKGRHQRGLFLDGQLFRRELRSDEFTGTTVDTRELRDVQARLRDMDQLGVAVQILFPTVLLVEVTRRPELEVAVCESYNRWIAERCADSGGRLRWAGVLPLRSMPDALREMRRVKEAGAVAIFKRSFECNERRAGDPYFAPIYTLAQELDLPICIHTSHPYTGNLDSFTKLQSIISNNFYVHDAFLSLVRDGMCETYPRLRFGFIEAAAGWVPHVSWLAGFDPAINTKGEEDERTSQRERFERFLSNARLYVTCQVSEHIPELLEQMGDSSLMVGSDYTHDDRASVQSAHRMIAERRDITTESIKRLTHDNAQRFYGLDPKGLRR